MVNSSKTDDAEISGIVCECGDDFDSIEVFQEHFKNEHQGGVKPTEEIKNEDFTAYQCSLCELLFMTKRLCNSHIKRFHKLVPKRIRKKSSPHIICEICGKTYSSNAALRYHRRVHTGEKPYHCTMCPKKFTMPLFLQIHVRTHTGEKPYECKLCPKAFNNKAALLRHDRVHTGVKPYECPKCCTRFTQSNSMKLHVNTVHYKMPAPYKSKARKLKDAMRVELSPNRKTKKQPPAEKLIELKHPIELKSPIQLKKPIELKTPIELKKPIELNKIIQLKKPVQLKIPVLKKNEKINKNIVAKFVNFEKLDVQTKLNLIKVENDSDDEQVFVKADSQQVREAEELMNNDGNVLKLDEMGYVNFEDNGGVMKLEVMDDVEFADDGNVYEIVEIGDFTEMKEEDDSNGREIAILYSDGITLSNNELLYDAPSCPR